MCRHVSSSGLRHINSVPTLTEHPILLPLSPGSWGWATALACVCWLGMSKQSNICSYIHVLSPCLLHYSVEITAPPGILIWKVANSWVCRTLQIAVQLLKHSRFTRFTMKIRLQWSNIVPQNNEVPLTSLSCTWKGSYTDHLGDCGWVVGVYSGWLCVVIVYCLWDSCR